MHSFFSGVKAVGFDLDRTLYIDTPEMGEKVAQEVFKAILKFKPDLKTIEKVGSIYKKKGEELQSWLRVFKDIGMENCQETLHDCLEAANLTDLIEKDEKLVQIIEQLRQKFSLFLITRAKRDQALKKLTKIGIRPEIFHFSSFGNDGHSLSESYDKNFAHFLAQSPYQPSEHIYIGDNLRTDIMIPKNLGMKTILVGTCSKEADFSVSTIHEIAYLLLP